MRTMCSQVPSRQAGARVAWAVQAWAALQLAWAAAAAAAAAWRGVTPAAVGAGAGAAVVLACCCLLPWRPSSSQPPACCETPAQRQQRQQRAASVQRVSRSRAGLTLHILPQPPARHPHLGGALGAEACVAPVAARAGEARLPAWVVVLAGHGPQVLLQAPRVVVVLVMGRLADHQPAVLRALRAVAISVWACVRSAMSAEATGTCNTACAQLGTPWRSALRNGQPHVTQQTLHTHVAVRMPASSAAWAATHAAIPAPRVHNSRRWRDRPPCRTGRRATSS
jgi:hypothetical protein